MKAWIVPSHGSNLARLETWLDFAPASAVFDRGFARESGLKILKPGQSHQGSVTYSARRTVC